MNITIKYERFGSHSGDAENFGILGCDSVVWPVYSGVLRDCTTIENCPLLGYYVASSGNFLPTFWNLSVPSSGRRNP